jgi:hypothetical protein
VKHAKRLYLCKINEFLLDPEVWILEFEIWGCYGFDSKTSGRVSMPGNVDRPAKTFHTFTIGDNKFALAA